MTSRPWRVTLGLLAGLIFHAALAVAQTPLFQESFDGPDGSRPSGWIVVGAAEPAFWLLKDARLDTGNGDEYAPGLTWFLADAPSSTHWRNIEIITQFIMLQDVGQVGLTVRWQNEENYYAAILQSFRRPGSAETFSQVEILKVVNGFASSLAVAMSPGEVTLPTFYGAQATDAATKFAFRAVDHELVVLVDDKPVLEAVDYSYRAGAAGIGQAFNQVLFDNLSVRPSDGGTGVATRGEIEVAAGQDIPPANPAPTSTPAPIPGLTPPTSSSAPQLQEQFFLVVVDHNSQEGIADGMLLDLKDYPNVKKLAHGDGTFSVEIGPISTREEAERLRDQLSNQEGFLVYNMRQESSIAAQPPRPTSTPALIATPAPTDPRREEIARLRANAERLESERKFEEAKVTWGMVMATAGQGPEYEYAKTQRQRIIDMMTAEGTERTSTADEPGGIPTLAIFGGLIVLAVILGGLAFAFMRNRKKGEELRRKVEQLSKPSPAQAPTAPAPTPGTPVTPIAVAAPQAAGQPMVPVGAQDRIRPGVMSPAPGAVPSPRQPTPQRPGPTPATLSRQPVPTPATPRSPSAPEPTPQRPPAQTKPPTPVRAGAPVTPPKPSLGAPPEESESLKLDFLFEEQPKASPDPMPAPPSAPELHIRREPSTEFIIPPQPDSTPGAPPPSAEATPQPVIAVPPSSGADHSIYYLQDFNDEEVGQTPRNWRGQYDYASLAVVEEGGGGIRRCLRFEKKNGVGSAYYSCKFPNATGRIGVEFDIRCDDKNKYLLGFYIEKDEDFRQSIHTIVHRTNSSANPTLRIQNESTPYEFGKWMHIKFEIDLPRHLIDGYADGKPIAMGVRLNSAPKAINTLSIRDNLATTGVLLVDNIRIYRM